MIVLRLLVMVLSIICLMDGHAEVLSSTTGIRHERGNPTVEANEPEMEILDRKKPKKPKKPKKNNKKKKPKPKKPILPKPVTTTPLITTYTLKTTTSTTSTASTITTAETATITTAAITTALTTISATTPTATTSASTTTTTTMTTVSLITTTVTTTATTATIFPLPTIDETTANSGGTGECKAINGKPCIFPYKDGNKEYSECKNHGGKYFWCATAIYDSGKYKHWAECSRDGSCPLEGDGECRATNNKPCVFPFKDGSKEYNECADFRGSYFWCATGVKSSGKYTSWGKCPKDGSCPLLGQTSISPTSTDSTAPTESTSTINDTSATANAIANVENMLDEIGNTLQNLETAEFTEDEKDLLQTMATLSEYFETSSLTKNLYDPVKINNYNTKLMYGINVIKETKKISPGYNDAFTKRNIICLQSLENAKLAEVNAGDGRMYYLHTVTKTGSVPYISKSSVCCSECKNVAADSKLFEYSHIFRKCDCYTTKSSYLPKTMPSTTIDSGICASKGCDWLSSYQGYPPSNYDKRVIGGLEAKGAKYVITPWMASIRILPDPTNPNTQLLCGGVLISCQHILTALHCLTDKAITKVYPKSTFEIFLGSTKRWDIGGDSVRYYAKEIFYKKHDKYGDDILILPLSDPPRPVHDIALIKLDRPIDEELAKTKGIYPIELPKVPLKWVYDKDKFWFAGWGQTVKDGKLAIWSDELLQTNDLHMILDQQEIDKLVEDNKDIKNHYVRGRDIFFRLTVANSVCHGDSGSPGMLYNDFDGKWYLYTIASWNLDEVKGWELGGCGYSASLHINVFSYLDDINKWKGTL